ncbi:MAG: alkane 1-monooxygenase [Betaproteobacteria bacterium]|nr:alkane 1-monooxygenase [Betaproteobacteria bacterium]
MSSRPERAEGFALRDARFLLALTVAGAPVIGHLLGQYWYALAVFFVAVPLLDFVIGRDAAPSPPEELLRLERNPFLRFVLHAWVPLQVGLIAWGAWLVGRGALDNGDALLFTASVGLATGGAGITIAHELGHKRSQLDRLLSRLLLVSVSYGHFTVEHNRGHHARVATPEDPASARYGEGFWRFLPRTLAGSFAHAWQLDRSEVLRPWAASLAIAATLGLAFGPWAVAFFFGQAAVAVLQLEAVNYIEHYGLERSRLPDGRYERPTAAHAWDAYERLSNCLLVHLQRHADHHLSPGRPFGALQPQAESPKLPAGYPAMVPLALLPPLWFAVMNPRVLRLSRPST